MLILVMIIDSDSRRILMKCAEELSELSTVILQELNKKKCKYHAICREAEDVELRLNQLKRVLKNEQKRRSLQEA